MHARPTLATLLLASMIMVAGCGSPSVATPPAPTASPPPTPAPTSAPTVAPTQVPAPTATVAAATPTATVLGWDQVAEMLKPSTVMVRASFPATAISDEGEGSGTGIVISNDGYILTNDHVVEGASSVTVALSGSAKERPARIVGTSTCDDLAIIKAESATGMKPATLGDSSALKVGQEVAAIGYPLGDSIGTDMSMTRGIISKADTALPPYESLLQTDAAINPGNSGGPLVNRTGEVVGVDTLGVDPSVATNINFAISINQAKSVIDGLEQGHNRLWLGMNLKPNTYEKVFGYKGGVVVDATDSGSPASHVGVEPAYLLTKLEGSTVNSKADVCKILRSHGNGDVLKVQFLKVADSGRQLLEGEETVGDPKGGTPLKIVANDAGGASASQQGGANGAAAGQGSASSAPSGTGSSAGGITTYTFDSDTGAWPTGTTQSSAIQIDGGAYTVALNKASQYDVLLPKSGPSAGDMAVGAMVQVRQNATGGVALRYSSTSDDKWTFYYCGIDASNHFTCGKYLADTYTALQPPTASDKIKPGQPNWIVMGVQGTSIAVSINDSPVAKFTDSSIASGAGGLYVATSDAGTGSVSVTQVKVQLAGN